MKTASEVSLDLQDFAMVHSSKAGVDFIEGAGAIAIDGKPFCTVEKGRLLVAAEDGQTLSDARRLRLMTTVPTKLTFSRDVVEVAVTDGADTKPVVDAARANAGKTLDVDGELNQYVVLVTLATP